MQSIEDISEEDAAVVRIHQDNQQSISSIIDHHSNTLDILKHVLSSCKTHVDSYDYDYPNLDPATTTQNTIDIQRATPSFADGLGYSTLVGHMDDECVVFEASSGGANEHYTFVDYSETAFSIT
ncbi:hypothetical protein G6F43_010811 [Rhizopus delemar]|nr:hypothetical protein G6F43_010811 [Rhizopus delemar]